MKLIRAISRFLRQLPFGYSQEDFRNQRQLIRVWGWGTSRYEVYCWPSAMGINESAAWLDKLTDRRSRYHRVRLSAELVLRTKDWNKAKAAMWPKATKSQKCCLACLGEEFDWPEGVVCELCSGTKRCGMCRECIPQCEQCGSPWQADSPNPAPCGAESNAQVLACRAKRFA